MNVLWAHVDAGGNVVEYGTAIGTDIFLQSLEPGLTAVARHDRVTHDGRYRYINNDWVLQDTP
jgi:hypothetical protein